MRHGESIGNTKHGFISGRMDKQGLTTNGRAQVTRTAWELKDESIDYILASPVTRAQETAQIMSEVLHKKIETIDWLTELNHGVFEGHYWWEVIHEISPSWRKNRTRFQSTFPEGESMEMLAKRIWQGFKKLQSEYEENETILIISHQAPISAVRYSLEHGDPTYITTPQKEEEFLTYMNTVQIPNACYAEAVLKEDTLVSLTETTAFDHVKPSSTTILFYMKGVADMSENTQAFPEETASNNIVYKLADREQYIVKVLQDTDSAAAKRQVKVYDYLRGKGISAPHIKYFDTSAAFFKADVLVQDFVEGHVFKECIQEHNAPTLLDDIYEVLAKIHKLPVSELETFWKPPVEKPFLSWQNFMHYNINLTLHGLQDFDLSQDQKNNVVKELADLKQYILDSNYLLVPIHGDPGSGNFIIAEENHSCKLIRIIDFEWARQGDGLWDFAYFWGWLERDNREASFLWKKILQEKIPQHMNRLNQFRMLFHAWTVRDMHDYKDKEIRLRRGKKSLELLA